MSRQANTDAEAAYFDGWQDMYSQQASWTPFALAKTGGAIAINLSQVFIAGYQAAIRAVFAQTQFNGWVAFVVSEDRSEINPLPGVTAQSAGMSYVLNGHKSWVAAVEFVQDLVVRAGGEQPGYYPVGRHAEGLHLDVNLSPSMLPALSQGRAHFDNVRVEHRLDDKLVPHFAAVEAMHIYVAFVSYAQQRASNAGDNAPERLAGLLLTQAAALDATPDASGLAELDVGVQQLRRQLAAELFADDTAWQQDQRLIAMYSKGIQARS